MGIGDRKSKKEKIHRGTYGKRRPRKITSAAVIKENQTEKKK